MRLNLYIYRQRFRCHRIRNLRPRRLGQAPSSLGRWVIPWDPMDRRWVIWNWLGTKLGTTHLKKAREIPWNIYYTFYYIICKLLALGWSGIQILIHVKTDLNPQSQSLGSLDIKSSILNPYWISFSEQPFNTSFCWIQTWETTDLIPITIVLTIVWTTRRLGFSPFFSAINKY